MNIRLIFDILSLLISPAILLVLCVLFVCFWSISGSKYQSNNGCLLLIHPQYLFLLIGEEKNISIISFFQVLSGEGVGSEAAGAVTVFSGGASVHKGLLRTFYRGMFLVGETSNSWGVTLTRCLIPLLLPLISRGFEVVMGRRADFHKLYNVSVFLVPALFLIKE